MAAGGRVKLQFDENCWLGNPPNNDETTSPDLFDENSFGIFCGSLDFGVTLW